MPDKTGEKSILKKKATINDVANMAGVVPSTVSHVVNGTASISKETKERVLAAIEQLNYSPNATARALRQNKSGLIGVVLQDISSEFYAKCAASLLKSAHEDNYNVLLCDASFDNDIVREGVNTLIERRVDGLIFIGGGNDRDILQIAIDANVTVVLGDRHVEGLPSLEYDNMSTVQKLVCALYDMGYRKFAYAGEPLDVQNNLVDRYMGYVYGLQACHLENVDRTDILDKRLHSFKLEGAYKLFDEYYFQLSKDERPQVILTSNDMIAQGFISAARRKGIRVPEDLAIVGFDDIRISALYEPPLTTIRQDETLLGQSCYKLFKSIKAGEMVEIHKKLPQQIIVRKSAIISPEILKKYQ